MALFNNKNIHRKKQKAITRKNGTNPISKTTKRRIIILNNWPYS